MRRPGRVSAVILLGGLLTLMPASVEARRELPRIETLADPCTETCAFNLCVVEHQLQRCTTRCGLSDLRVVLPAYREVIVRLPQYPHPRRSPQAELVCDFIGALCLPCRADADCDDRDPATLDVCSSPSCAHICPGG